MNVEGDRRKRPGRIAVPIPECARRILMCQAAMQSAKNGHRSSESPWKGGILTPPEWLDVPREEVGPWVGMLGENAFKDYVNGRLDGSLAVLDLNLRAGGDGGVDFTILGLSVQVKTRTKEDTVSLVRRADDSGQLLSMRSKVHVFCQYDFEDRNRVMLLGWIATKVLEGYPLRPARVGKHLNIEVDDRDLLPMNRLIDQFLYLKESRRWR
jgi:hypothetical protein